MPSPCWSAIAIACSVLPSAGSYVLDRSAHCDWWTFLPLFSSRFPQHSEQRVWPLTTQCISLATETPHSIMVAINPKVPFRITLVYYRHFTHTLSKTGGSTNDLELQKSQVLKDSVTLCSQFLEVGVHYQLAMIFVFVLISGTFSFSSKP